MKLVLVTELGLTALLALVAAHVTLRAVVLCADKGQMAQMKETKHRCIVKLSAVPTRLGSGQRLTNS